MFKPIIALLLASSALQAADSWIGTWKLDPSRSHFEHRPAIKELTLVISQEGDAYLVVFKGTLEDGKSMDESVKQPVAGGKLVAITKTDIHHGVFEVPNDHEWVFRYYSGDGKLQATRYVKLSEDGMCQEADMQYKRLGQTVVEHEYMLRQ